MSTGFSGIQLEGFRPLEFFRLTNHHRNFSDANDSNTELIETLLPSVTNSDSNNSKKDMLTSIFNLSNNVAGAGILTLSAAMASGTGWLAGIIICSLLSLASAHTFTLIGTACDLTGHSNFRDLWSYAFGKSSAYVLDFAIFFQCFLSSVIYCGLLSDIFSALLPMVGYSFSRSAVITIFGIVVLLPLCLIRNLAALGFTSILGLVAVLYTAIFITYRSIDGTYALDPMGKFIDNEIIYVPSFSESTTPWNFDISSLILCANLGLAFNAHYNAPTYWRELPNANVKSFGKMVRISYYILAALYSITMCAGYATFGNQCRGNILLNYHPNDNLATLGRLATGISVTFGFPLVFYGAREGLKGATKAIGYPLLSVPRSHNTVVTLLLAVICVVAMTIEDIKFIASLSGAIMGSFLVYICPTLIYIKIIWKVRGKDSTAYKFSLLNLMFIPFGLFVATVGVIVTIKHAIK